MLIRLHSNIITLIAFDNRPYYKRRTGRLGLIWIGDVQKDLTHTGIKRWRQEDFEICVKRDEGSTLVTVKSVVIKMIS